MPYKDKNDIVEYSKRYYALNRDVKLKYANDRSVSKKDEIAIYRMKRYFEVKALVFKMYGNKCNCPGCDESNTKFLTIDHVNNDGAKHKMKSGRRLSGMPIYLWAINNDFPDTLQLLCWNCNCGKQWNGGTCPHLI